VNLVEELLKERGCSSFSTPVVHLPSLSLLATNGRVRVMFRTAAKEPVPAEEKSGIATVMFVFALEAVLKLIQDAGHAHRISMFDLLLGLTTR
jgi:hypothetical protein